MRFRQRVVIIIVPQAKNRAILVTQTVTIDVDFIIIIVMAL